jgi:hypothetical protein
MTRRLSCHPVDYQDTHNLGAVFSGVMGELVTVSPPKPSILSMQNDYACFFDFVFNV